jgi:hypothetical protein
MRRLVRIGIWGGDREKEGRGRGRRERLWDRSRMRVLGWGRRRIILRVWQRWCLFGRRIFRTRVVGVRGVRRRLWKMEMDNGVVRDVIKVGMRLFIGNFPSPPRKL